MTLKLVKESILGLVLGLCFAIGAAGCPEIKTACQVIRVVDDACMVLELPLQDGGIQQVRVTGSELRAFAAQKAAQQDGGTK